MSTNSWFTIELSEVRELKFLQSCKYESRAICNKTFEKHSDLSHCLSCGDYGKVANSCFTIDSEVREGEEGN